MSLSNPQIRKLKSLGQRLDPLVHLGKAGVTDAFVRSVAQALHDHELIKIRFAAFQDQRRTLAADIAARTQSELVMIVGHVAVLFRAHPDPARRRVLPEA